MTAQSPANLYTQGFGSRPENVEVPVVTNVAPSTSQVNFPIGKRWINTATNSEYVLTSSTTSGGVTTPTWTLLESGTSSFLSLTGDTGTALPSAGNVKLAGTANQISTSASGSTVTFALTGPYTPATYTAHGVLIGEGTSAVVATAAGTDGQVLTGSTGADPSFGAIGIRSGLTAHGVLLGEGASAFAATAAGATGQTLMGSTGADPAFTGSPSFSGSVTAATTITATLGDITATNGNLVMGTAGNKIIVPTGSNASAGTSGVMSGTPGAVVVATTACSATAKVFYCRNVTGGTPGEVSITAQDGTGFTLTSTGNETSTFNWWIINA
jgi:hypothetical protein